MGLSILRVEPFTQKLMNARSGLVKIPHLPEWKLIGCLGSKVPTSVGNAVPNV